MFEVELKYVATSFDSPSNITPDHADINQCAESNGGCAQQCTNLVPGFECSCNPGYQLGQDGASCSGR